MKICPNCQQTYDDNDLNFCLTDGGALTQADSNDPPPTVMMGQARPTHENFKQDFTQPNSSWQQSEPLSPWQSAPVQQQTPAYIAPSSAGGGDQTLPIVSLVLGSLGAMLAIFTCVLAPIFGLPLGFAALITGYMGMNNADRDPQKYMGRGLAIGGMITGGVGILVSIGWLFLMLLGAISDKR